MKTHFNIVILINALIFANSCFADDNDYPRTKKEREFDEMSSITGGKGITFSPSRVKNESTKSTTSANSNVNKYLWQSAIETLNFAPLTSSDSVGGVIITDWYSPKDDPNVSLKINVFIKDNVISPESITVTVFGKMLQNNVKWTAKRKPSDIANELEDKILRLARENYIKSERK